MREGSAKQVELEMSGGGWNEFQNATVEGMEVEGSLEAWLPGPGPCLAEVKEPVGKRKRKQFLGGELIQGHLCRTAGPSPLHTQSSHRS